MKIIDNVSAKFHLIESGHGQTEVKFALINKESGETMTPFCKCKDYFSDVFWVKYTGNNVISQYGFSWHVGEDKGILDRDNVTLAILLSQRITHVKETITQQQVDSILSLLNKIERKNNFNLSIAELCEEKFHIILTFDRKWTEIPYLISAFFMFLRLGFKYEGDESIVKYFDKPEKFISPHDQMYLKKSAEIVKDIENGILDYRQKYLDYTNQSNIHNYSGICNYKDYKKQETAQLAETI